MRASEWVRRIHEIRRELLEEEERLGAEEFTRRQRERVTEFLQGTRARFVSSRRRERRTTQR